MRPGRGRALRRTWCSRSKLVVGLPAPLAQRGDRAARAACRNSGATSSLGDGLLEHGAHVQGVRCRPAAGTAAGCRRASGAPATRRAGTSSWSATSAGACRHPVTPRPMSHVQRVSHDSRIGGVAAGWDSTGPPVPTRGPTHGRLREPARQGREAGARARRADRRRDRQGRRRRRPTGSVTTTRSTPRRTSSRASCPTARTSRPDPDRARRILPKAGPRPPGSPAGVQRPALGVAGRTLHADDRALVQLRRGVAAPA